MNKPILYSFRRCPYAIRARIVIILTSQICELREVLLRNKPSEMLDISPKGTVPVLQVGDEIFDESLDIIEWALQFKTNQIYKFNASEQEVYQTLLKIFDRDFKYHLDRYKYPNRYEKEPTNHQQESLHILLNLENAITHSPWIFGNKISLLDICILPFIRQYKIANPSWFYDQDIPKTIALLNYFESSELFQKAMTKFNPWDPSDIEKVFFPSL